MVFIHCEYGGISSDQVPCLPSVAYVYILTSFLVYASAPSGLLSAYLGSKFPGFMCLSALLASSSPRLRISPALGALSLGVAASRFRYAAWRAVILIACRLICLSKQFFL